MRLDFSDMPLETAYFGMALSTYTDKGSPDTMTLTGGGWGGGSGLALVGQTANNTTETHVVQWEVPLPHNLLRVGDLSTADGEVSGNEDLTVKVTAELTGTPATSATIDIECYQLDGAGGIGSDLCATGAQNMLTAGTASTQYSFTVDGSGGLTRGRKLLVLCRIVLNDSGGSGGGTTHLTDIRVEMPVRGW
jgi:hypothetical protein